MMMNLLITFLLVVCAKSAFACQGPESEKAQESEASVVFEAQPIAYELTDGSIQQPKAVNSAPAVPLAKVTFKVTKNLRGEKRQQWKAIMRGSNLPKSLSEFVQRFSSNIKVGLRDFGDRIDQDKLPKGYSGLYFIVDAACSMNGEDWLLRPIPQR